MSITSNLVRSFLLAGSIAALAIAPGCGDDGGATIDANGTGGGNGNGDGMSGGGGDVDGPPGSGGGGDGGTTGDTQCSDGIDNDGDMDIDSADPECTSAEDNEEGSFATGIPGDNMDAKNQDCFFDGNSGQGQYGCNIHVCCLYDNLDECPEAGSFNPDTADCEAGTACADFCLPATPPGCDCFGCCTVVFDDGTSADVLLQGDCSTENPDACIACTKVADCSNDCTPEDTTDCLICPGEELPPECGGETTCAEGQETCDPANPMCPEGAYCYNGCCIAANPE